MFSSRQVGAGFVSVRLHPVKLLILGLAMIFVGAVAIVNGDNSRILWAVPVGILVAWLGIALVYIGGRQIIRGLRTFFS